MSKETWPKAKLTTVAGFPPGFFLENIAVRSDTLLEPHADWPGVPPTASDCYRYCLAQPSVQVVLTAPRSFAELEQNLDVLELPPISKLERGRWQRFGDLVYGAGKGAFETSWPESPLVAHTLGAFRAQVRHSA